MVRLGHTDLQKRTETLLRWASEGKLACRLIIEFEYFRVCVGKIRPWVSHVFSLDEVADAFGALWARKVVGRCVIAPLGEGHAQSKL